VDTAVSPTEERAPYVPTMAGGPLRWLALALVLGACGQLLLDWRSAWGVLALALAAALFAVYAPAFPRPIVSAAASTPEAPRWPLVGLAIVLGLVAIPGFAENRYTLSGVIPWALAIVCIGVSLWPAGARVRWPSGPITVSLTGPVLLVLAAIVVGAFLRLHRIHSVPLEMGCDLPLNYANVAQILRADYPIFFESYPGREGLFFYLAAPMSAVAGLSHTSIKVTAALIGVLSIVAVYLLGREIYDRWTGAVAALLLAISHWHIIFSRVGYRAVLAPLLVALSLLYLVRALKRGRYRDYALCALCVGLGLQSYNALMIVPVMVGLALVFSRVFRSRLTAAIEWRSIAFWVLVVLLTALPLICYVGQNPKAYIYRVATRTTAIEAPLPENLLSVWLGNAGRAAAMFNYQGDSIYLSNVPRLRQLGFVTAVFFVLGAVYSATRRPGGYNWLLWVAFAGLMFPSTLALAFPDEVPSAVRSIGALPVAMLLSAVGIRASGAWVHRAWQAAMTAPRGGAARRVLAAILGVAIATGLIAEAASVYPLYFQRYVAAQPNRNESISLAMANTIDDFADDGRAYILIAPYWYDGNAVRAQLRRAPKDSLSELVTLEPGIPPLDEVPGRVLVIVHPDEQGALVLLENDFTSHLVLDHRWDDGTLAFRAFYGER
jgi:4-amino-4-deoxy-L-arabinose transferase-like glycosyltransferase